jgi:DDE superfamily endonuclease
VVCADEKPSIQARARIHPSQPATPGGDGQLVEHEYERKGALCYLAAWDAQRAKLFDRCAPKDGIVAFDQLVEQFMSVEPYSQAQRIFVIVDNGSAHRGQRSIDRLQGAWPNLILVHTPVHASWVNQAEIYFSIAQRKVLQPNNFADLDTLEQTLLAFGRHYEQIARPFEWKFTRKDLHRVLDRLKQPTPEVKLAA